MNVQPAAAVTKEPGTGNGSHGRGKAKAPHGIGKKTAMTFRAENGTNARVSEGSDDDEFCLSRVETIAVNGAPDEKENITDHTPAIEPTAITVAGNDGRRPSRIITSAAVVVAAAAAAAATTTNAAAVHSRRSSTSSMINNPQHPLPSAGRSAPSDALVAATKPQSVSPDTEQQQQRQRQSFQAHPVNSLATIALQEYDDLSLDDNNNDDDSDSDEGDMAERGAANNDDGEEDGDEEDEHSEIVKSPYEMTLNAEDNIKAFNVLYDVLNNVEGGLDELPTNAGSDKPFAAEDAKRLIKAYDLIEKSGILYSQEWVDGNIRGSSLGKLSTEQLLLCLIPYRFIRASEFVLSGMLRDLQVLKLIKESMFKWNLADRFPRISEWGSKQLKFSQKRRDCLKCEVFVGRAFSCIELFGPQFMTPTLFGKIKTCLTIMEVHLIEDGRTHGKRKLGNPGEVPAMEDLYLQTNSHATSKLSAVGVVHPSSAKPSTVATSDAGRKRKYTKPTITKKSKGKRVAKPPVATVTKKDASSDSSIHDDGSSTTSMEPTQSHVKVSTAGEGDDDDGDVTDVLSSDEDGENDSSNNNSNTNNEEEDSDDGDDDDSDIIDGSDDEDDDCQPANDGDKSTGTATTAATTTNTVEFKQPSEKVKKRPTKPCAPAKSLQKRQQAPASNAPAKRGKKRKKSVEALLKDLNAKYVQIGVLHSQMGSIIGEIQQQVEEAKKKPTQKEIRAEILRDVQQAIAKTLQKG